MGDDEQQRGAVRSGGRAAQGEAGAEPDVLLDVPEISVDSLRLAVDALDADLSLRTRLANLLQIDAGVRLHLEGVELDITGVHAEALLKVRLENVARILERAMATVDRNPQILGDLAKALAIPVDDVNRAARQMATKDAQISGTVQRPDRPKEEFRVPREPEAGGATEELGQQVGAIGAVADQGRREGGAESGGAGAPAGGPGARGPSARGPGLASGSGGGGEEGEAVRARERQARADQDRERRPEAAGGDRPATGGADEGEERRSEQPSPGGAAPSAAQLAEQAGETLRQAGRSVWEAIQGGMAHRRHQD
ncbi:hypothetical protein ACTMSW_21000 [Micromonospora sp. BQ11]|uniref:hypothetical protein n=1 Tax=Micromonospora sp. BQ11 TaxID=3452212 RepID=UPI003F8CD557